MNDRIVKQELALPLTSDLARLEQSRNRLMTQMKVLQQRVESVSSFKAIVRRHPVLAVAAVIGAGYLFAKVLFPRKKD
jgi:hypothetical protein